MLMTVPLFVYRGHKKTFSTIWICLNFVLSLCNTNRVLPLSYRGCSQNLYYVYYNNQTTEGQESTQGGEEQEGQDFVLITAVHI